MRSLSRFVLVGTFMSTVVACSEPSKRTEAVKPSERAKSSQTGASSSDQSGSSSPSSSSAPADLLSIPAGNSFVVSCTRKIKLSTNEGSIVPKTEAGRVAFSVLAELSQKGGVKTCSEYWTSGDDTNKAYLIEDQSAICKIAETASSAELSLKAACPRPQTGSQSLKKTGEKNYFRNTVYISAATPEQLKKLSAGWSEMGVATEGEETRNTDDLR